MISHKLAWTLSIGTFLFGMFADSWLSLQRPIPMVEVDHTYRVPDRNLPLNGKIQIELVSVFQPRHGKRSAIFKVTNRRSEPITYSGYSDGGTAQAWVRQNGKIFEALELDCWNGVNTQTLDPATTTRFTVPIPNRGDYFDVGFDFRVGLRAGWETVWFRFPEYPDRRR